LEMAAEKSKAQKISPSREKREFISRKNWNFHVLLWSPPRNGKAEGTQEAKVSPGEKRVGQTVGDDLASHGKGTLSPANESVERKERKGSK